MTPIDLLWDAAPRLPQERVTQTPGAADSHADHVASARPVPTPQYSAECATKRNTSGDAERAAHALWKTLRLQGGVEVSRVVSTCR